MDKTNETPRTESETSEAGITMGPLNPAARLALTHPTTAGFYNKLLSNGMIGAGAASHQIQGSTKSAPSKGSNSKGLSDTKLLSSQGLEDIADRLDLSSWPWFSLLTHAPIYSCSNIYDLLFQVSLPYTPQLPSLCSSF